MICNYWPKTAGAYQTLSVSWTISVRKSPCSHARGFKDMAPEVDKLEQLVAERKLRRSSNPILNMYASVTVIQSYPAGQRKLNKAKSF